MMYAAIERLDEGLPIATDTLIMLPPQTAAQLARISQKLGIDLELGSAEEWERRAAKQA